MNYLVHPSTILERALTVEGFSKIVLENKIEISTLLKKATAVAEEWTLDWNDEDGFGSSDGTYLLKDFIDTVIYGKGYKTKFNPFLSIVKTSDE